MDMVCVDFHEVLLQLFWVIDKACTVDKVILHPMHQNIYVYELWEKHITNNVHINYMPNPATGIAAETVLQEGNYYS